MRNILTQKQINHIKQVCGKYIITNYTINSDGSIDVDCDVDLAHKELKELPLKFDKVSGYFSCDNNKLRSLKGCPIKVGGHFYCGNNELTSLKGSPSSVGGDFYCYTNQLTSLEGSPSYVDGDFNCTNNQLTSLKSCLESVGGSFYCGINKLTSLEFSPIKVGGDFDCSNNKLPRHFMDLYNKLSDEEFKIFIKYQDDLRIWEDVYKEEAAHDLFDDIKDGMR